MPLFCPWDQPSPATGIFSWYQRLPLSVVDTSHAGACPSMIVNPFLPSLHWVSAPRGIHLAGHHWGQSFWFIPGAWLFHLRNWFWRSLKLSLLFLQCVQPHSDGLGMKPSMQLEELFCLDISGFHLLLWWSYYTSRVSNDKQGVSVDGLDLVITIQLTSQDSPYSM